MSGPVWAGLGRSGPVSTTFFGFRTAPTVLFEPFRRPPADIWRPCCESGSLLYRLRPPTGRPGTSKIKEFCKKSYEFLTLAVLSSSRLLESILDLLGLPFGTLLATKMAETCLGNRLGPAQSRSRLLLFGPGGFQERSKRLPRAVQEASKSWSCSRMGPRGLWEPPRKPLGADFDPSRNRC